MMSDEQNIELFELYQNGELFGGELTTFEARLAYDSEFREAFEQYKQLENNLKLHFRAEMKAKLQDLDLQLDNPPKKSNVKQLVYWSSSVAAALIIGIFVFRYFSAPDPIQLAEQYWPYEAGLPVKMSTKGKYDDAMNAFKQENWAQAEELLLKIDSDTATYYLGVINYEQQDYQQASAYFSKVPDHSTFYQEAQFRLGLVLIMVGEINRSQIVFKDLIDRESPYSEQAKKILKGL